MKVDELRESGEKELTKKLADLKDELFNLRFQSATGQLDNHMRIRHVKRDIARVKTVMRAKELQKELQRKEA